MDPAPDSCREEAPALSVVVVVLMGKDYLARCLEALERQSRPPAVEILVAHDARLGNTTELKRRFPEARFLELAGTRTCAEMRASGVASARGGIVALTEDHCMPRPDWCAQVTAAHERPHAAIGGAVEKDGCDTGVNWAVYFSDYVRYMTPAPESPVRELTDCNVSYKRPMLDAVAEVWRDEFHEPRVHGALQARGESLWFSPRIVVGQQRSLKLGRALRDRYAYGRLFGSTRIAGQAASTRLRYACLCTVLPLVLVARVAGHVLRKNKCTTEFLRALPALALMASIWAWGEFVGYVTGRATLSLSPREAPVARRSEARNS